MKTMNIYRTGIVCTVCAFICLCNSCTPSLQMTISAGNAISIELHTTMGTASERLLRSVSNASDTAPLITEREVAEAVEAAGLKAESISVPANGIRVTASADSLAKTAPEIQQVFSIQQKPKYNELTISISPETLQQVAGLLEPDTAMFLDLLMAPVFTGEEMSAKEYTGLLEAFYGKTIADELNTASLTLTIHVPKNIILASAENGMSYAKAKTAQFTIPMVSLLTNSDTSIYCVQWHK